MLYMFCWNLLLREWGSGSFSWNTGRDYNRLKEKIVMWNVHCLGLTVYLCMMLYCGKTTPWRALTNSGFAITSVLNLCFGYSRRYSLTQVLLETGLLSFDTVMHNSTRLFARSWQRFDICLMMKYVLVLYRNLA